MYLRPADKDQPVRLLGWQAVTVASGESATVTVTPDDPDVAALRGTPHRLARCFFGGQRGIERSAVTEHGAGDIEEAVGD